MKPSLFRIFFAVVFLLCSISNASFAQGLFTAIADNAAGLSNAEMQKLASLRKDDYYLNITCIKIGDTKKLQDNKPIDFTLPGHQGVLYAEPYRVELKNDSEYSYWAQFRENGILDGDMYLIHEDGVFFGQIRIFSSDEVYEIYSLEAGTQILNKVNADVLNKAQCGYGVYKEDKDAMKVFPLPAKRELYFSFELSGQVAQISYALLDATGRIVQAMEQQLPEKTTQVAQKVDVSGVGKGLYFLRVQAGSKTFVKKVLIAE